MNNCLVDYTFKSKEELEKLHTKQLLNELDFIRRNPSECSPNNSIQAIEGSQYENYYADGTLIQSN